MQSTEDIIELFRKKGRKITPQRRTIFKFLAKDADHPTAEEIYQRILPVMPDVSRTTVYNTLRELVALGELSELEVLSEWGMRYDTNIHNHHHLFCMHCQAMIDISRDFEGLELSPDETLEYQIVKHQVTFYGYCPECQVSRSVSGPSSTTVPSHK